MRIRPLLAMLLVVGLLTACAHAQPGSRGEVELQDPEPVELLDPLPTIRRGGCELWLLRPRSDFLTMLVNHAAAM